MYSEEPLTSRRQGSSPEGEPVDQMRGGASQPSTPELGKSPMCLVGGQTGSTNRRTKGGNTKMGPDEVIGLVERMECKILPGAEELANPPSLSQARPPCARWKRSHGLRSYTG